jgi:competence protein ComEC
MFSALQLSVATSSLYISLNTLAATAFAMLVYRPDTLFDISFQLSFVAVVAILLWGVPLMKALRTRRLWADALIATMVVGTVSSVATMPLVAHTFGTISLIGVLLNPIVILCAYIIVIASVIWLALPFAPLAPIFTAVLSWTGAGLNFVVAGVARLEWSAVDISLPMWAVWIIYGIAIAITAIVRHFETKKSVNLPL